MFTVKYYSKDQLVGKVNFVQQEKAVESIYESPYASCSDFYEIIDNSTGKTIQEFMIAPPIIELGEVPLENPFLEEEWFSWATEDF